MTDNNNNSKAVPHSLLRQPMKVSKADFPVQRIEDVKIDKENQPELLNSSASNAQKRKKTEADLRENLRQRKLNTTISGSTVESAQKKRLISKPDLNQTLVEKRSTAKVVTTTKPTLTRTKSGSALNKITSVSSAVDPKKSRDELLLSRLDEVEKLTFYLKDELKKNQTNVSQLSGQLQEKELQINHVRDAKILLQSNMEDNRKELQQLMNEKIDLQNKIAELQHQHNLQMQDMLYKNRSMESQCQTVTSQLSMSKAENETLKLTIEGMRGQVSAMQGEIDSLKFRLQTSDNLCQERKRKIEELQLKVDQDTRTIADLEAEIREDETIRKKLHNTIQELKGNIRVFCRIRPLIGAELVEFGSQPFTFQFLPHNDRTLEISTSTLSSTTGSKNDKKYSFSFDKVFKDGATQGEVFSEISQLVQSALDGYNACIFAYGQTGSGKTYTMEGPGIDSELDMPIIDVEKRGMIPRAVEQIFSTAETLKDKGWNYEMEVMYLEIYNESIRDLLCQHPSKVNKDDAKYEIKHDQKGNTTVTGITTIKVRNSTQVYELLRRASKNRAVSKTNMNECSSRSHSVFQMKLIGTNTINNDQIKGILNLIDLAGSERLDRSGTTGLHLKETQNINRSLASLGDVIAALANKESHIPYRNSKLTYLLQNSLGGNSKTLMFVNISPRPTDLNESISSLRFATKVNACEIGTAKKQAKVDLNATIG